VHELASLSEGFTGADIESAVREIGKQAHLEGDHAVSPEFFRSSFENVVPLSKTNPEQIEAIRDWGRARAVPASGWPTPAAEQLGMPRRVVLTR
jgi:hypothetical protein